MTDFTLKQGDLRPALLATFTDATGARVNLTGATVILYIRRSATGDLLLAKPSTVAPDQTPEGGTRGDVSYSWAAGETDVPGEYVAEWVVTFADGTIQTFPTEGAISLSIREDVENGSTDLRLLRSYINEESATSTFSDEMLRAALVDHGSIPAAAQALWTVKAAKFSGLVDVSESGSSRKMSDLHKNALAMSKHYGSMLDVETTVEVLASRPRTRAIVRG